jgi:hypothetical protein
MTCLNPKASEAGFRVAFCQCAKCIKPRYIGVRFQVAEDHFDAARPYKVIDMAVKFNRCKGRYTTKSQAQARARTLNSRNGGK